MFWKRRGQRPPAGHGRTPLWFRVIQAAFIGIVAGFVFNAILSMVVLQGRGVGTNSAPASECRRARPARDAATPPATGPAASSAGRTPDRFSL